MTPPFCPESGKIRHPSESAAMAARLKSRKQGKQKQAHLNAYFCHDCNAWHLGHSYGTGNRKNRERRRKRRTNRKGIRF